MCAAGFASARLANVKRNFHSPRLSTSDGVGGAKPRRMRVLGDRARQDELQQVVGAAGLAADARHLEAAERLPADQGAGDAAVEIQVADQQLAPRALQVRRAAREDAAGQRVVGAVGDARTLRPDRRRGSRPAPGRRFLPAPAATSGGTSAKMCGPT